MTDDHRDLGPTPLPVMVDALSLSSVAAGSGIGTYTRNLLHALALRTDLAVSALVGSGVTLPENVRGVPVRRCSKRPRAEVIEHSIRLPADLARSRRGEPTVFHNPTFHAPLGIGRPWVQSLHDVIPLVFDYPDLSALRKRWRRFGPRYRRADAVIAVSRHAADEGIRLLGLDPGRVYVAPHGVGPEFIPGSSDESDPTDRPYLLVVGEFSRRKGFGEAFEVMDRLVEAGFPHRLVVAGRIHDWGRAELAALRARSRHPERIEIRGFVPDLVRLYQQASVFLMPSRYEGFGLPVLEAMACGLPVVGFANSAIPEVVGDGGILVPDGDVDALAAAVRQALTDPSLAEELAERARCRAGGFSWGRSAGIHADVYRLVAGGR
ncbi:MAG: glycosyltransferase family 4 protein [Acidimicrobiales bacterium]